MKEQERRREAEEDRRLLTFLAEQERRQGDEGAKVGPSWPAGLGGGDGEGLGVVQHPALAPRSASHLHPIFLP